MYLAKMTTAQAKEAFEKDPIIVIPVGSTEQHGTQGALGTDFMVPSYLADHVEDVDNVIVAPTVPYGVCPYHLSFEGSINIGYEGLYMVLHGIMDSLMQHGAKRFVVLNGHGGNTPSIDRAALEVYHKGGVCASVDWWSLVAQLDKKFDGLLSKFCGRIFRIKRSKPAAWSNFFGISHKTYDTTLEINCLDISRFHILRRILRIDRLAELQMY